MHFINSFIVSCRHRFTTLCLMKKLISGHHQAGLNQIICASFINLIDHLK